MTGLIPPERFNALAHPFRHSVFRLETLQTYHEPGEVQWVAAFNAGAAVPPPDPEQDEWEEAIRGHRRGGRVLQRVHVVVEPLTEYLRYELTWAYAPNVRAGEDIRIVPVVENRWPVDLPRRDFWLFDSSHLFDAWYDADGVWLGVEAVSDPAAIVAACRFRDAALSLSEPWYDYVTMRPELAARIPAARPDA